MKKRKNSIPAKARHPTTGGDNKKLLSSIVDIQKVEPAEPAVLYVVIIL